MVVVGVLLSAFALLLGGLPGCGQFLMGHGDGLIRTASLPALDASASLLFFSSSSLAFSPDQSVTSPVASNKRQKNLSSNPLSGRKPPLPFADPLLNLLWCLRGAQIRAQQLPTFQHPSAPLFAKPRNNSVHTRSTGARLPLPCLAFHLFLFVVQATVAVGVAERVV